MEYERLIDDPEATLQKIVDFIGLEPTLPLRSIHPAPRESPPPSPELAVLGEDLSKSLSRMGYPYSVSSDQE